MLGVTLGTCEGVLLGVTLGKPEGAGEAVGPGLLEGVELGAGDAEGAGLDDGVELGVELGALEGIELELYISVPSGAGNKPLTVTNGGGGSITWHRAGGALTVLPDTLYALFRFRQDSSGDLLILTTLTD